MNLTLSRILSYFKSGYRNILSSKSIAFINIGGLSTGLAAVILITLFVVDELSYDKWVPNYDNIYRVDTTYNVPGQGTIKFALATSPMQPLLQEEYPTMVEEATRNMRRGRTITFDDKSFNEQVSYVDNNFFRVFDLPMIEGDRDEGLIDNTSILLSESTALKFFGDVSVVGKTITLPGDIDHTVKGVFKDIPDNSHMDIDLIALMDRDRHGDGAFDFWAGVQVYLYVKMTNAGNPAVLEEELGNAFNQNVTSNIPGLGPEQMREVTTQHLIPLTDIHFRDGRRSVMKTPGSMTTVYSFASIAVLILVIACINFMNLATARSAARAREISVRKVLGARRKQLIQQFLGESTLLALISLSVALLLANLAMPGFNAFLSKTLTFEVLTSLYGILSLLALVVLVAVGGGIYPAVYLSNFKPAEVLMSNQSSSSGSGKFRNILVFIQFSISIALIISTIVVYSQTLFARNMDMGFNKDQMLILGGANRPQAAANAEVIKNELNALPGVINVTRSTVVPPITAGPNTIITLPDQAVEDGMVIEQNLVDYNYFETYGIELVAGRWFSEDYPSDALVIPTPEEMEAGEVPTQSAVMFESAIKVLGLGTPEEALGKIYYSGVPINGQPGQATATIIGVVKDAHFHSIHTDITPMTFVLRTQALPTFTVHLKGEGLEGTLTAIDRIWANVAPEEPIARTFIDQNFAAQYAGEEQRGEMFLYFSVFTIFVACLGLYGLAAYNSERRTKEIGIRKVLGANVGGIVKLLVWQFTIPVIIANIIAWPVAYYLMADWLETFSYRIDLSALYFLVAGGMTLAVACFTVAHHAYRVARKNPIHALRYE